MLLNFLLAYAGEFRIIFDRSKTQINSSKKFETGRHRALYDSLLDYINSFRREHLCLDITQTVLEYLESTKQRKNGQITIEEVKLLIISDIINKFRIGKFHLGMLDYAKEFDNDLIKHWNVLVQYDIAQIRKAMATATYLCKEEHFVIKRSVNYILWAYMTYMYEMVISQLENNRWYWSVGSTFVQRVRNLSSSIYVMYDFIVKKEGCYYTELNFDIKNIFAIKPDVTEALALLGREHGLPIYVIAVYRYSEIMDAFLNHHNTNAKDKPSLTTPEDIVNMVRDTITGNNNLKSIITMKNYYLHYKTFNLWRFDRFTVRNPQYYSFLSIDKGPSEYCTFSEWIKKLKSYEEEFKFIEF